MLTRKLGTLQANIAADTKDLKKGLADGEKQFKAFGRDAPKWVKPASTAMTGIGVATVAGVGLAVKHFASFELAMKNVQAVSGATATEFDSLKDFAIEMGSQTVFTATEAAEAMYHLASAGLAVQEQMDTTVAVLDLAAATQTELAESSRIVVNTMSGFSLAATDSRRIADVFAKAISSSQANMSKLGVAMPVVSATMEDLGISLETTVTGLSMLFDKGGRAETAATGLRNAMKKLIDPNKEAVTEIERLGLTVGDLDPKMNSLAEIIGKLEQAGFDTAASINLFGLENDAMNKLVTTGKEEFEKFETALKGAAGAAEEMKDVQLDSLAGDIDLLKSAVDGAVLAFGEEFSSLVGDATEALTKMVTKWNNLGDTTKSIIAWTTALGGVGIGVIGAVGLLGVGLPVLTTALTAAVPLLTALGALLLGPVGIAIAAVGVAIGAVAIALDTYKTASSDVFFEEEFARAQGNIEGYGAAIAEHEGNLETYRAALDQFATQGFVNFDTATAVAATGVTGIGEGMDGVVDAIDRLEKRIETTKIEQIMEKGGTREFAERMVKASESMDKVTTSVEALGKSADFLEGSEGPFASSKRGLYVRDMTTAFDENSTAVDSAKAATEGYTTSIGAQETAAGNAKNATDGYTTSIGAQETKAGNARTATDDYKIAVDNLRQAGMDYTMQEETDSPARIELWENELTAKTNLINKDKDVEEQHKTTAEGIKIIDEADKIQRRATADAHIQSLLDVEAATVDHSAVLDEQSTFQKALQEARAADEAKAQQDRILGYQEFTKVQTISMKDFLVTEGTHYADSLTGLAGWVGDLGTTYDDIRTLWSDLTGSQLSTHSTWLTQFTDWTASHFGQLVGWYTDTKKILEDVLGLWNNTASLINKAWSVLSGEEGGILNDALEFGDILDAATGDGDSGGTASEVGGLAALGAAAVPVAGVIGLGYGIHDIMQQRKAHPGIPDDLASTMSSDFNRSFMEASIAQQAAQDSPMMGQALADLWWDMYEEEMIKIENARIAALSGTLGDPSLDPNLSIQQRQQALTAAENEIDVASLLQQIADNTSGGGSVVDTFDLLDLLAQLMNTQMSDDGYINSNEEE